MKFHSKLRWLFFASTTFSISWILISLKFTTYDQFPFLFLFFIFLFRWTFFINLLHLFLISIWYRSKKQYTQSIYSSLFYTYYIYRTHRTGLFYIKRRTVFVPAFQELNDFKVWSFGITLITCTWFIWFIKKYYSQTVFVSFPHALSSILHIRVWS